MAKSKTTNQDDLPQAHHVLGVSMSPHGPYLSTADLHAPIDLSLVTVVVELSETGTEVVSTAVTFRSAGMGPVKVYVGDTADQAYASITEVNNIPVQVRMMVEPRVLYRWITAADADAEKRQTRIIQQALQQWSDASDPLDESGLPDDGEYQTVPSTNDLPVEVAEDTSAGVPQDDEEAPFDTEESEDEDEDEEEYEEVDEEEYEEVDEDDVEYEEVDEEEYEEVDEEVDEDDVEYEDGDEEEYDEDDDEGLTDEDIVNLINEVKRMKTIDGVLEIGRNIGMTDARCRNRTKTLAGIKRNVIRELESIASGEEE